MTVEALHPEFPNLSPAVVKAYRDAPPELVAEVLDGQLFAMTRPSPRHANATAAMIRALGGLHGETGGPSGPGGWVVLPGPELRLGRGPETAFIVTVPDWVCEVISRAPKLSTVGASGVSTGAKV